MRAAHAEPCLAVNYFGGMTLHTLQLHEIVRSRITMSTLTRFCERCERLTTDGNLWCQEKDCPAERGFPVFNYGDFVGDLKIIKLVRVWRSGALYEAKRNEDTVLVKVAHADPECEERLRNEAKLLESLGEKPPKFKNWRRSIRPIRLRLLPPFPVASKRPYGEITIVGITRTFCVYEHVKGKILSDLLLENPQLWHYEAAWVIATVAQALRPLAAQNKLHLSISPDMILIDVDVEGHLRSTLLDLGWGLPVGQNPSTQVNLRHIEPGYAAPEVLTGKNNVNLAADTYSLGLVLYEMLAGHAGFKRPPNNPVLDPKLFRDDQVRKAVIQNRAALPVQRPELEGAGVVELVQRAISPSDRYVNVIEMVKSIIKIYGNPPIERRPVPLRVYIVVGILAVLLLALLLFAAYILITGLPKIGG